VRSVQVNGLAIDEGHFIGLVNDDLVTAGPDALSVAREVFERLGLDAYEVVTVYYGADVDAASAQRLVGVAQEQNPSLEIEVVDGGQAHYHYVISVE